MDSIELFLFGLGFLLVLCVVASKVSGKLGIPTLVVFLGVGILAGSEGLGGIYFDNFYVAQTLGIIALSYILFSGGLDTKFSDVKPILWPAVSLATLGVFLTCIFVGLFLHFVLHFTLLEGLLIGAIISSTDAGAVFSILRSKGVHLKGNLKPLLELESGSNDPMAVFLTTSVLTLMQNPDKSILSLIPLFFSQMIIGFVVGYFAGKGTSYAFNKLKLEYEGLYMVLSLSLVPIIYSIAQGFNGNGFLAVYVAGVVLGNTTFIYRKTLLLLHDGISWLMQSMLFLTLGLLLFPSKVLEVTSIGLALGAFLIFIARPISVYLSVLFHKQDFKEKTLVAWVGLRGSVPVVMATYPLVAGIEKADLIFNIVFFVALTSLVFQGTSIPLVSRLLKVDKKTPKDLDMNLEQVAPVRPQSNMFNILVPENSVISGKQIVDLKLPSDLLIVIVEREGKSIIPRGATEIHPKDILHVLGEKESINHLREEIAVLKPKEEAEA